MIIRRIRATRFGCLNDFEASFEPGLNVIQGPNEAGKSTLHRALLTALFERPSPKRSNEDKRTWGAAKLCRLEIEFELPDGTRWILTKDFEENTCKLTSRAAGSIGDWEKIRDALEEAIGTSSLRVFKGTVCVSQDELKKVSDGKTEISEILESIMTGGDDEPNTSEAIADLERVIGDYERGVFKFASANPGPLARLIARQTEWQERVNDLRSVVEGQNVAQDRLVEIEANLLVLQGRLKDRRTTRDQADKAGSYKNRLAEWKSKEDALDLTIATIADAQNKISEADSKLAELQRISSLTPAAIQELTRLNERVRILRELRDNAESRAQGTRPTAKGRPDLTRILPLSLVVLLGLAGVVGGVAIAMLAHLPTGILVTSVGILLLLGGLGWLIKSIFVNRKSRDVSDLPAPASMFDYESLSRVESQLANSLKALGCNDWTEFGGVLSQVSQLEKGKENSISRLDVLLPPGMNRDMLEIQRREASGHRRDAQEILDAPEYQRVLNMTPVEYQELTREIAGLEGEQEKFAAEKIRMKERIEGPEASHEDLLKAQEQLSAVTEDLERERERLEVYKLTLDTMNAARSATMVRAQDELGPKSSSYLKLLTNGRYSDVEVESDLDVVIKSPNEAKDTIEPNELSKGTQDQLYFSLRLALVDSIFRDASPPLFLDDPFVKFDEERRQAALGLCQQIAKQRQVLLFTCSNEYGRAGHSIKMKAKTIVERKSAKSRKTAQTLNRRSPGRVRRIKHRRK